MKNTTRKLYCIPPCWSLVIIFTITAVLFILFDMYDIQSGLAIYAYFNKPGIILSCIFAILATSTYSFYSDRLEVRILSFTISRICWNKVTGAMYFRSLANKPSTRRYQPYLIICVSPCEPVDPSSVDFAAFDRKNLRHLVRIPISGKETKIFEVMEQLSIKVHGNAET